MDAQDEDWPATGSLEDYVGYLRMAGASKAALRALRAAWRLHSTPR